MSDYDQRFGSLRRLVGVAGAERLSRAHVCVIGIGGVGSWTVEALARSGIGALTLVDLDEVCITNVNRQVPALDGEIGAAKVDAMARRVRAIYPECSVHPVQEFFTESSAERILEPPFDYLIDAIDSVANKCLLLAKCRNRKLPVVTAGGAGGRTDPTLIRIADLAFSSHDSLLQQTRKRLRAEYGFPREPKTSFGIDAVFSTEPALFPQPDGTVCRQRDPGTELRLNCDTGFGTASFVTGAFGFAMAAHAVKQIVEMRREPR